MSQDAPSIDELLITVREFVDEIAPQLDGRDRYHALCASFVLEIVRREIARGEADETAERAMLARYLDAPASGPAGIAALARAIRAGGLDERFDELLADLTRHVVDKVRVTRPEVLHPMHRDADATR